MEYYYTPKENISENSLVITGDEAKHLNKVLRKNTGEEIYVTDGHKNLYKTVIDNLSKDKIECRIIEKYFDLNEPKLQINLYQSILKNPARFEFVIEKATELGVYEINPLITETVINKKRDKSERWQSIALSAMKQSQRCYLPIVNHPVDFNEAVKSCKSDLKIIAHEKELSVSPLSNCESPPGGRMQCHTTEAWTNAEGFRQKFGSLFDKLTAWRGGRQGEKSIAIFIGPEGGFTDNEISIAADNEFQILNLGKRKYRSETAALVVMSLLSV